MNASYLSGSRHFGARFRKNRSLLDALDPYLHRNSVCCPPNTRRTLPAITSGNRRWFAQKHKKRGQKSKQKILSKRQQKAMAFEERRSRPDTVTPRADNLRDTKLASPFVPPALLSVTASPHVFCAKIAAQRANIDPRTQLFSEFAVTTDGGFVPHTLPTGTMFRSITDYKAIQDALPRIAFLGRSNVGKSSLLNALVKRKIAVTSKQPGRTQDVYFYAWQVNDILQGYLVDLPGYGFAVGPEKAVQDWQRRTQQFLLKGNLTRLYLLQDARVGPTSFDHTIQGWLEEACIPYTVVLTKLDGVRRPAEVIRQVNQVCMRYHHEVESQQEYFSQSPMVHITSSKTGAGLAELWSSLEADALAADAEYEDDNEGDELDDDEG